MDEKDMEKCIRRLYSKQRSGAKSRGLSWDLTRKEHKELVLRRCDYCGSPPSNRLKYQGLVLKYNGLDRMDGSRGYSAENLRTSCQFCNSLRGPMKWETWAGFLVGVLVHHGAEVPDWLLPWIDEGLDPDRSTKSFYRHG